MNKTIFFYSLSMLVGLSCTKEIEIDLPEIDTEIVVNALIEPFTYPYPNNCNVYVSQTNGFLDTADYTKKEDAIVYLQLGDNYDTLIYNDSLNRYFTWEYISNEIYNNVKSGDKYTLSVEYDGDLVTGSDIMPYKPKINRITVNPMAGNNSYGDMISNITVYFDDPIEINYYELSISYEASERDEEELFSEEPSIISEIYYPSVLALGKTLPKTLPFSDHYINGKDNASISFNYYNGRSTQVPLYGDQKKGKILLIHLRSVSYNYYMYKTSKLYQDYSNDVDILYGTSEPVSVYSNIENGKGIFACYQTDIKTLLILPTVETDTIFE